MPIVMRLMGLFGTTPEKSVGNAVRLLTAASADDANGAALRNPKHYNPEPLALDPTDANRLWAITDRITQGGGVTLP